VQTEVVVRRHMALALVIAVAVALLLFLFNAAGGGRY
jgi:hypothetical protein